MKTGMLSKCLKSFPVKCKTGVYADSESGIRVKRNTDESGFAPDLDKGKSVRVKKKLIRPLYTYSLTVKSECIKTEIFCAEEINKHGLVWKESQPIYCSEYYPAQMTFTERGIGKAKNWFCEDREFDVAELMDEVQFKEEYESLGNKLMNALIQSTPYGDRFCTGFDDTLNACYRFLVFLYSGEYQKLVKKMSDITRFRFGMELEFTGIARGSAANVVAKVLNSTKTYIGGAYHKHIIRDQSDRIWTIMRDGSIIPVPEKSSKPLEYYKCELVTPICTAKDIPTISKIVRALKKRGMIINSSCGLHIHIDGDEMDCRDLLNLVNIISGKEDVLYKALNVPASRVARWCRKLNTSFVSQVNAIKPSTLDSFRTVWYRSQTTRGSDNNEHYNETRYQGLNLHSLWEGKGVEFRCFNSTDNAEEIKAYILLTMAICDCAIRQKRAVSVSWSRSDDIVQFRSWLNRIGLTGDRFVEVRRQLMKNLKRERRAA